MSGTSSFPLARPCLALSPLSGIQGLGLRVEGLGFVV
jgi:hypothetical protein